MPYYVSISVAANLMGFCTKTLRRWDSAGIFNPSFRTLGNHRRYNLSQIKSFRNRFHCPEDTVTKASSSILIPRVAIYSRVSTSKQKKRGDLDRQEQKLRAYDSSNNLNVIKSFRDVGSGLNDSRSGLHRLIKFVSHGHCDLVIVSYSDRLARFGVKILKACFSAFGADLRFVAGMGGGLSDSEEAVLVNDITAILYSYMGKLYRMRRNNSNIN